METTQTASSLILPLAQVRAEDAPRVGDKAANLGELLATGIPVPEGFVISVEAHRRFMTEARLPEMLHRHLAALNVEDPERLAAASARLRKIVTSAPLPPDLEAEVRRAYAALGAPPVAVRPSVVVPAGQPEAAGAGQLTSRLNVRGAEHLLAAIRDCWASLFDERSLFFRAHQHVEHLNVAIALVVQRMVAADVSGVMFTADPVSNDVNRMVIEAALGQGEAVLSGAVTPDMYHLDKATLAVQERSVARQQWKMTPAPDSLVTARTPVADAEGSRPKLTDAQILTLARLGLDIERHFGWPQDIEWALAGDTFWIVQTKPVAGLAGGDGMPWGPRKELTGKLLVSGAPASPGVATGTVRIVHDAAQAAEVRPGEVLVAAVTNPDFLGALKRAAAVVTDTGGRTSHAAIVSRELGIPCVVGADHASKVLHEGQLVTVDGTWGRVLEGAVQLKSGKVTRQRSDVKTRTLVLVNLAEPDLAETVAKRDVDGVGLLRAEFMIADLGEHPRHALEHGRREVWVGQLAQGIERFCAAFAPRPVLYRTSDFQTNEYRSLTGGQAYEAEEENPMLGYRGAARYLNDPEPFLMELEAIKRTRQKYTNLSVMIPFVRTTRELQEVKRMLLASGLRRSKNFELWMMAEVPSNVLLLDQFLDVGLDGVSIGSNDLTQLLLGVDRDNPKLAALFDERSPAVMLALEHIVTTCKRRDVRASICGQAPSEYPEITRKLVEWGIDSISVSPDMIDETRRIVADAERRLAHEVEERARQPRMPAPARP